MASDFSAELIESCLSGSFGRPLRFFDSIGSTNTEAMTWAADGAPHGAVVAADHQTQGRGRWGRSWFSSPGALLQFSLILRPRLSLEAHGLLTAGLGVAASRAIDATTELSTRLKWPNDVTVDGKKIVGMLVETAVEGSRLAHAVCGVGVNVHLQPSDLPDELRERASSIAIEMAEQSLGEVPARARLLCAFLEEMEGVCTAIESRPADVIGAASDRSEVLGKDVVVRLADETVVEGRAERLGDNGALILDAETGPVELHVGEIAQLRER